MAKLREALPQRGKAVFVCSSPDRPDLTDVFAGDMRRALEAEGYAFSSFQVLDARNGGEAAALMERADLAVFAGGHVPTQNAFFQRVHLKEAMANFHGTVIGISAGSMNAARVVYAQPEEPGEATDPKYRRFLPGLGLTDVMLLPHYQKVKDDMLDGMRLFEEITYADSMGRAFYAIPDGSYLLGENGRETLYGEAWRIADGKIEKVCGNGEKASIK